MAKPWEEFKDNTTTAGSLIPEDDGPWNEFKEIDPIKDYNTSASIFDSLTKSRKDNYSRYLELYQIPQRTPDQDREMFDSWKRSKDAELSLYQEKKTLDALRPRVDEIVANQQKEEVVSIEGLGKNPDVAPLVPQLLGLRDQRETRIAEINQTIEDPEERNKAIQQVQADYASGFKGSLEAINKASSDRMARLNQVAGALKFAEERKTEEEKLKGVVGARGVMVPLYVGEETKTQTQQKIDQSLSGIPIEEQEQYKKEARLILDLANGSVKQGIVNNRLEVSPSILFDDDAVNKAVAESQASDIQKEAFQSSLPQLRKAVAEGELPALSQWSEFNDFVKENNLQDATPFEKVSKFKNADRNWFSKAGMQTKIGLAQAHESMVGQIQATIGSGLYAYQQSGLATDPEKVYQLSQAFAAAAGDQQQKVEDLGVLSQAVGGPTYMADIANTTYQMVPAAGVSYLTGLGLVRAGAPIKAASDIAFATASGAAGLQSYASTYMDATETIKDRLIKESIDFAERQLLNQGVAPEEARKQAQSKAMNEDRAREIAMRQAYLPSIINGLTTATITALGGKLGPEAVTKEVVLGLAKNQGYKQAVTGFLKDVAINGGGEFLEETPDQFIQGVVEKLTYNPEKTMGDIMFESLYAGGMGFLLGGAGGVIEYAAKKKSNRLADEKIARDEELKRKQSEIDGALNAAQSASSVAPASADAVAQAANQTQANVNQEAAQKGISVEESGKKPIRIPATFGPFAIREGESEDAYWARIDAIASETPEQRVARLQQEAKAAVEIPLEEEIRARFLDTAKSIIEPQIEKFDIGKLRSNIALLEEGILNNTFKIEDFGKTQFKSMLSPDAYTQIVNLFEEDPQAAIDALKSIFKQSLGGGGGGGGGEGETEAQIILREQAKARITEREGQTVTPVETPAGNRVEAAAYQAPDGTVYYGPSHLDAMAKARDAGKIDQAAIDAKQEVTSRETPEFGFATNADPFVSRDQAETIARQSGQITVEQPATGKLHSNEVSLDAFAQPVTPMPTAAPAETITQAFTQMGEGAVDSYYQAILQSLQERGEVPTPERRSNVGQAWERVRGKMTPEEFVVQLRQNAEDPSKIQAPEAASAAAEPIPVAPPPVTPQLEPLRRVARAEQTEEDVAGLVDGGLVEVYKGQPVITQAGLEALPEAERPRLTPEARKIQIDTRTSEAAAEAISKNLRIGVDQVPVDVRMPAGWILVGDVYVPPQPQAVAPTPTPEVREARIERDPEVQKAAQDLKAGTINRDEYQRIVDMRMPLRKFETVPTPATNDDMLRGLGERTIKRKDAAGNEVTIKKQDLVQAPESIAEGTVLESRLDIPAYENADVWVVSLHEPRPNINKGNAGPVVAYTPTSVLRNVEFGVTEKAAANIAAGKPKTTIATMKGEYVPMTAEQAYELANTNKEQWVEIGMNPVRHSYFYDKDTQTPVVSAEEVVQVGGMVLAKNPVFGKREDYLYARRVQIGRAGMETSAVEARLQELGFPTGGIIRVVNQPDADFEGRTIILDGKVTGIELNAAAMRDNATIDRVLNHEFAESANADGALNKLVERLTPKEKKEINDTITRLRYEERARTSEEAARAIEALAEAWKGRGFFTRAVARIEAWASKLGFKLTRRAAEYIAARNLAEVNENVRKWHIGEAMANIKGARRIIVDGVQAVLIPPTEMRMAYSIVAYHGTPHEIKGRFQVAKIGTGEGATAYGWGLYFAENIKVAKEYQRNLSKGQYALSYEGVPVNELPTDQKNAILKIAAGISRETVIADLETSLRRQEASKPEDWAIPENRERVIAELKSSIEEAKKIKPNEIKPRTAGNLYRVELDLNNDQLLDWDVTFAEQSEQVKNAIRKILGDDVVDFILKSTNKNRTGGWFYEMVGGTTDAQTEAAAKKAASELLLSNGIKGVRYLDAGSREEGGTHNYVVFDENVIKITGRNGKPMDIRESRREPEAIPTFTEGTPEAATLKEMATSMAKVDAASEAKGGKPETYKISEIASVWMDSGLGERELQDAIVEYTNLTPANAARVAKAIAKQYGLQQQIAETGAVIAEPAPEAEGAPRKTSVQRLIEQAVGVRRPIVKLEVPEKTALKDQIRLKAREARETRKARKEAARDLAEAITQYVKENQLRGPVRARQTMSLAKQALKLDVNNEKAVDRYIMYVERVVENANYDKDLSDAKALRKRAKEMAKKKNIGPEQKKVLEAIGNINPSLLDNPFEYNILTERYLLGFLPVTSRRYSVMPDAEARQYLESLEEQMKRNQAELDRAELERFFEAQAGFAEQRGLSLEEAQNLLNEDGDISKIIQDYELEKRKATEEMLLNLAQNAQRTLKTYDDSANTARQKELISFMNKVKLESITSEEKKRFIRFANNILANGETFGVEQFEAVAKAQERSAEALKDKRLSQKMNAWIGPLSGGSPAELVKKLSLITQSEVDTLKNVFGREAVGAFRRLLGLLDLDVAQTASTTEKEKVANKVGDFYKGLKKKYGDDSVGRESNIFTTAAAYFIQAEGNKTQEESIAYRRRLWTENIEELRKSERTEDREEAEIKQRALDTLTGNNNVEILNSLRSINPAAYEQLMWWKDQMHPEYKPFLKDHVENFRNQANNYDNIDYLSIHYKWDQSPELPSDLDAQEFDDVSSFRIKQAANSIKRKDHPSLPVNPKTGAKANIDVNFGYNQYNALTEQLEKAYTAPAWEAVYAFTRLPDFEQIMGGKTNADFVKNILRNIKATRTRKAMLDDENQVIGGAVALTRRISTQAALGGALQPLRQIPDQLFKLFATTGRWDLVSKNIVQTLTNYSSAKNNPLLNKLPIGRRGDARAGSQFAAEFNELARKVEATITNKQWTKYKELMTKMGEFWMTPLRGSDTWIAKVSWMSYYEAELNKKNIKMESWEREAELFDTDPARQEAASQAEFLVDFYAGASDPTKMAALSKQGNNGWREFSKMIFLSLNSFALQQKSALISDARDLVLRSGSRKDALAGIVGSIGGMVAFHGMRIFIIGGLIYPAAMMVLKGIFGIDMDEPDEEEQQKQLRDNWRKMKASIYSNIVAGGAGQFLENKSIDAFNRTMYLWDSYITPDEMMDDKGEFISFSKYEKEKSPFYRFRSYSKPEFTFGLADVLTEQAQRSVDQTSQLLSDEEMSLYTGNEQAYALFATGVEWAYFFRLMDTDLKRITTKLKNDIDKQAKEREKQIKAIREGR